MVAGLNLQMRVWRISFDPDNAVGGAQPTGTVVYEHVPFKLQANKEEQLLLQQGMETQRTFQGIAIPGTLDIRERDEIEVTEPFDNVYHGARFRVVSVSYSSHNPRDPRNYLMLTLFRSVQAHANQ